MENAVDALKMAGSVLLFVLALSVIIPVFSQARSTSDKIMQYVDRETEYIEGDYFYSSDEVVTPDSKSRIVGEETIIPSIYRSYKENFKVVFTNKNSPNDFKLYSKSQNGKEITFHSIDWFNTSVPTGKEEEFIKGILYGPSALYGTDDIDAFKKEFGVTPMQSLYNKIHNKTFKEYLGVFYQEDLTDVDRGKPESNKSEKRVITYELQ